MRPTAVGNPFSGRCELIHSFGEVCRFTLPAEAGAVTAAPRPVPQRLAQPPVSGIAADSAGPRAAAQDARGGFDSPAASRAATRRYAPRECLSRHPPQAYAGRGGAAWYFPTASRALHLLHDELAVHLDFDLVGDHQPAVVSVVYAIGTAHVQDAFRQPRRPCLQPATGCFAATAPRTW